jgi:DNA-binding Lrp family transcriptional regulator
MPQLAGIDEKDKKILAALDIDARRSDTDIAKSVRLSKQVVNYRIQRMQEQGIIKLFYINVNVGKLGLDTYYVFLQLQGVNKQKEKEIYDTIRDREYVSWLASGTGRWDAVVYIFARNVSDFDMKLRDIELICGKYLHDSAVTALVSAEYIGYRFLGDVKHHVQYTERIEKVRLDDIDKKILVALSQDARMPVTTLAKKIKKPLHVTHYHLKTLLKNQIIESAKPQIVPQKLGQQWYFLLLQFQNTTDERRKQLISFCKQYKHIYYLTNTVGSYNLFLDIHVKSAEEFKDVLLEFKDKFSDVIKSYESMVFFEEHKLTWVTEDILR